MEKINNRFFLYLIVLSLFLIPINAHLDAGEDRIVGNFLVDFGYSPESPTDKEMVVFAINLADAGNDKLFVPTSMWVRISSSKEVVFTGTLQPEADNFAFTYLFPYSDDYEIKLKIMDQDDIIAETDFDLSVSGTANMDYYFITIIFLLLITLVYFIIKSRK